jgi:putative endonuclease
MKEYCVYIITNKYNKVLYTGVTNDISRRIYEHKSGLLKSFSKRYNLDKLVYVEVTNDVHSALSREKQIKGRLRKKKINLVNSVNPEWNDLSHEYSLLEQ